MIKNYLLSISYDGSKFYGLVKQPNKKTILGTMEKAFTKAFGLSVSIIPAGRTDAGVHALDQKISIATIFTSKKLMHYWNLALPNSIYINNCEVIKDTNFHIRYSAKRKTYLYKFIVSEKRDPFSFNYITQINNPFSLLKYKKALTIFKGYHDFSSVSTKEKQVNTHRTIENFIVESEQGIIITRIIGKSFLRHMIRRIIGSAIAIAQNKDKVGNIQLLFTKGIKIKYKAPPNGLYLERIEY